MHGGNRWPRLRPSHRVSADAPQHSGPRTRRARSGIGLRERPAGRKPISKITRSVAEHTHTARPPRATGCRGWLSGWSGHSGHVAGRPRRFSSSTSASWSASANSTACSAGAASSRTRTPTPLPSGHHAIGDSVPGPAQSSTRRVGTVASVDTQVRRSQIERRLQRRPELIACHRPSVGTSCCDVTAGALCPQSHRPAGQLWLASAGSGSDRGGLSSAPPDAYSGASI